MQHSWQGTCLMRTNHRKERAGFHTQETADRIHCLHHHTQSESKIFLCENSSYQFDKIAKCCMLSTAERNWCKYRIKCTVKRSAVYSPIFHYQTQITSLSCVFLMLIFIFIIHNVWGLIIFYSQWLVAKMLNWNTQMQEVKKKQVFYLLNSVFMCIEPMLQYKSLLDELCRCIWWSVADKKKSIICKF